MERIKSVIREELLIIDNKIKQSITNDNIIKNEVYKFINGNSKRIRSIIALLYLKTINAKLTNEITDVIVSAELIHNASLLHDDVIDNATIRRGQTTIAENFSAKTSILCGDYLVSAAVDTLSNINNPLITKIFADCTKSMSNAEIEQLLNINNLPELETYMNIIQGKTASLFSSLLESCAILSDNNREQAKKLGNLFGIIFQINNDLEDKSSQNDKENGVKTIKDILGIEKAKSLKDNYKKEYRAIVFQLPDNEYRKKLEDIVNLL